LRVVAAFVKQWHGSSAHSAPFPYLSATLADFAVRAGFPDFSD
jgi:hypothetical protein